MTGLGVKGQGGDSESSMHRALRFFLLSSLRKSRFTTKRKWAPTFICQKQWRNTFLSTPAIAQLAEHLTVDICSYQMVPGSIPGGRTFVDNFASGQCSADSTSILAWPFSFSQPALVPASRRQPSKCSHLPMLTNIDAFLAIGLLSSVGRACASCPRVVVGSIPTGIL